MPSASSVASAAMSAPTALSPLSAIAPMLPTAVSTLSVMHSVIASTPSISIITLPPPPWSHPQPHCHLLPPFYIHPTPALQHCCHPLPPALPQKTKKALNPKTNLATIHHHRRSSSSCHTTAVGEAAATNANIMLHTTSHITSLSTHVSPPTSAATTCSGDDPATATARQQTPPLHKLPHTSSTSMSATILPPPSPFSITSISHDPHPPVLPPSLTMALTLAAPLPHPIVLMPLTRATTRAAKTTLLITITTCHSPLLLPPLHLPFATPSPS
ncbi:hypothetical protein F5148DRAFT_1151304, partial [Russula earlei]